MSYTLCSGFDEYQDLETQSVLLLLIYVFSRLAMRNTHATDTSREKTH